jgi:hypothetical protein
VVYGYREGPRLFQEHFAATLEKRGIRRMKGDACMFRFKSCLMVVHVDDLIVAGRVADREELTRILHEEFEIKISEVMGSEWCRFLGCEWRQLVDGVEARIPPKYFKLTREGLGLYQSKGVATPYGAAGGSTEGVDEQQHSCYRTAVGRLLWTLPE